MADLACRYAVVQVGTLAYSVITMYPVGDGYRSVEPMGRG